MSKRKKKPFKIISDAPAFRDRLGELTGNELKVWMYFWLHTAGEGTAFPGNETIACELKINVDTVKDAKRGLRNKGWTSRESQRTREDGTFSTVVEKVHLPWGEKASTDTVVEKTDGGKTHQQKEYSVNPEVPPSPSAPEDSGNPTPEVEVSELVSELVSSASPPPPCSRASQILTPETHAPQTDEAEKAKPFGWYERLTPRAEEVASQLYPGSLPADLGVDIEDFNFAALAPAVKDWDEFFAWHRTHKPPKLIFRSAAKFLDGLEYAVNDYAAHDPKTCAVCLKLGKQQEPHDPYVRCDGCSGYASPKFKDENFCERCYRKYSKARNAMPKCDACGDKHTADMFCVADA